MRAIYTLVFFAAGEKRRRQQPVECFFFTVSTISRTVRSTFDTSVTLLLIYNFKTNAAIDTIHIAGKQLKSSIFSLFCCLFGCSFL